MRRCNSALAIAVLIALAIAAQATAAPIDFVAVGTFSTGPGSGDHTLEVIITDRFMRDSATSVNAFINFTVVPEPGTATLVAVGLVGLALRRRRSQGE